MNGSTRIRRKMRSSWAGGTTGKPKIIIFVDRQILSWHICRYQIAGMADRPTVSPISSNIPLAWWKLGENGLKRKMSGSKFLRYMNLELTHIACWQQYVCTTRLLSTLCRLLADCYSWNNTQIATVGKALASSEEVAYPLLRAYDVDYVLIIFGGLLGYSGDDINKALWFVRIAQGEFPEEVNEANYFTQRGEYAIGSNALVFSITTSFYRLADLPVHLQWRTVSSTNYHIIALLNYSVDNLLKIELEVKLYPNKAQSWILSVNLFLWWILCVLNNTLICILDEVFTSENWIVRIYQVRKEDPFGREHQAANAFDAGKRLSRSKSQGPTKKSRPSM